MKNDSTMDGYNLFASGSGGVCAYLWGSEADSYWCSNASAGGWAEVDQECAATGQLQIPVGFHVNATTEIGKRMSRWKSPAGGFVHAWHSQSWAMHVFEMEKGEASSSSSGSVSVPFAKGGGRQGGRNWCRCDQCTYAGGWCRQNHNPPDNNDTRLISGTFVVVG